MALTGVTMGGGLSHWASRGHVDAGCALYATPEAARSYNDDLGQVRASGIQVSAEDKISSLPAGVRRLKLKDFDFPVDRRALGKFGVSLKDPDAAAVAVIDHGTVPPGYSDRQFRFDYLAERLQPGLLVKDTAPAAILGATLDPRGWGRERVLAANIGKFHTLAFRLRGQMVEPQTHRVSFVLH